MYCMHMDYTETWNFCYAKDTLNERTEIFSQLNELTRLPTIGWVNGSIFLKWTYKILEI
jgi:hypothetical protein